MGRTSYALLRVSKLEELPHNYSRFVIIVRCSNNVGPVDEANDDVVGHKLSQARKVCYLERRDRMDNRADGDGAGPQT